jgi:WD repeat-containing protein 48
MVVASRRVSYILPSPTEAPPLLQLPPLGQSRQGQTVPTLIPKSDAPNGSGLTLKSKNPFLSTPTTSISKPAEPQHPRHCLGVTSLVLDTSTVLENHQSPGGILYSGGRDGLVASWELNVPHRKRRGRRYELPPGRAAKVRWERIGDGAELWDEEDEAEFGEDVDGNSSDEDSQGWVGVDGEETRKRKTEVAYEDRWEVDQELLEQQKVGPARRVKLIGSL